MKARTPLAVVSLAASLAFGCGGGNLASQLVDKPDLEMENQSTCKVGKSQEKPLIVEWPSGERTDLEATARSQLVVVRYKGCEMQILPRCKAPGQYAYTAVTPKQDTIVIKDEDELYANIPVGAARFEGKLAKAGQLNVAMTMVGKMVADRAEVAPDELQGSCDGATHIIVGLNVGAFEFFAGADAEVGASAGVGDVGAGAASRAKRETLTRDGDQTACEKASVKDEEPPAGCGASLRLEVIPLKKAAGPEKGAGAEPPPLECPAGTSLKDGRCMPKVSTNCPDGMKFAKGRGCIPIIAENVPVKMPDPPKGAPWRGPTSAPVIIQWFGEYQDPYTKRADPTLRDLQKRYPGKIRVVWRNAPLDFHKQARVAAYAAMEAYAQKGNGGFWRMHELLLKTAPKLGPDELKAAAKKLGLDMAAFEKAIEGDKHKRQVDADFALFNLKGFRGVPSFAINDQVVAGAQSIDKFAAAVDKALAGGGGTKGAAGKSPTRGPNSAKVEIVWFGAYQEPFTQKVAPTIARLEKLYRGKIRLIWKNHPMPFHKQARPAANAAMEAHAQGKFWAMHDLMIANRHALEREDLLRYGREAGLDISKLEKAIDSGMYDAEIDADSAEAKANKLHGVPSFLINGEKVSGARKYEDFDAAVKKALER